MAPTLIPEGQTPSTRPYLLRAIHEWCSDHGFTPYLAVWVDEGVQVPREFVRNNEIVLNVSYDVAREFYKDFNAAFVAHYKKTTGKDIRIDQSHAGSSAQARAVNDGLDADVVTMNTTTDIEFLASNGVVAKDWAKKFPNNASPTTSTMLFLTRNGNPKGIKDWNDLVRPDVQVITPNPKTSGGARWNYLAAWAYANKQDGGDEAKTIEFIKSLYANVAVLDSGARGSTTTFAQRAGYVSPDFDKLIDQADVEGDPAKRAELYQQAQDKLVDDNPVAFFWNNVNAYMVKPWVSGYKTTPQDAWPGDVTPGTIDIDTSKIP